MVSIKAQLVFEIMGRPPEHISEALQVLITKISQEKGVKVISKKISDPAPVKDAQNLFMSFTDIEIECDSLERLFGVVFVYMPSHVEVFDPENLKFSNTELSAMLNFLAGKLHMYDSIAKKFITERDILQKKLDALETMITKPKKEVVSEKKPKPKKSNRKKKK